MPAMYPIVEKLGGWAAVDPLLEKWGVSTGYEATKKWRARGMAWPARFALALEARKRKIEWAEADFLWHEPVERQRDL